MKISIIIEYFRNFFHDKKNKEKYVIEKDTQIYTLNIFHFSTSKFL